MSSLTKSTSSLVNMADEIEEAMSKKDEKEKDKDDSERKSDNYKESEKSEKQKAHEINNLNKSTFINDDNSDDSDDSDDDSSKLVDINNNDVQKSINDDDDDSKVGNITDDNVSHKQYSKNYSKNKTHKNVAPKWCYNEFKNGICNLKDKGCTYYHTDRNICPFGYSCPNLRFKGRCNRYHFTAICHDGPNCELLKVARKLFDVDLFQETYIQDVFMFVTRNSRINKWKNYWERTHKGENMGNNPLLHVINCRHYACMTPSCPNYVCAYTNFKSCGIH